jgi:hypothetical protein
MFTVIIIMSVISNVIQEEYQRLMELLDFYNGKIAQLPRGSVTRRIRGKQVYYYHSFRNHNKVLSLYIGKDGDSKISEMEQLIKERHQYEQKRRKTLDNLKELKGLLSASKRQP